MITIGARARILASLLAIVAMTMYSGGDTAILVGVATGGVLLMLGFWAMSRTTAVGGFLVAVGAMAYFTELETMTDAQSILFALVALFIPALVLGSAALTAEVEHAPPLRLGARQVAISALFAAVCLASVPIAMVLGRLMTSSMSFESSMMLEMAVIMVVASAMMIYVFTLEPRASVESPEDAEPE